MIFPFRIPYRSLAAAWLVLVPVMAQVPDIPYTKYVLDNGLTLIVHEDHKAPIVAVNVWYHVGSKNEKPGKTGFAHLFEHLMFNGSEHYNDDYFMPLERVGATDMNGTTNEDRTNYFQNVPTSALDVALWMESDRMGHLLGAIDQAKLDEQRGVVQNEKRQYENEPYAIADELITTNTYPAGHPYSWTVIGSMEDLDAASLEDVHAWFQDYYGPANAVLVLAGDIDPETARAKVEHYFGDIPSGPPVARQQAWTAKMTGTHRQVAQDRVPQARIYKVWNIPPRGTPELTYLDLVTDVLGAGKTSRLYKRLVYDDQIATDVAAFIYPREIGGQLHIRATAKPGIDLAVVENALDEELGRFLSQGPSSKELARIKIQYRARFIRGIERVGGFGGKSDILASNEVYGGRPDFYKTTFQWMEEANSRDLRNTARKWLSDGEYILEIHPFPEYSTTEDVVDRSTIPRPGDFPELTLPDRQEATLSNGLKVILAERHEIPVVEFMLLIDAGYAADQYHTIGTAGLTLNMLDEGTTKRSALEISDALANLGAGLYTGSTLDMNVVYLSALKENLAASLELYADVILRPSFPERELDRLKHQQLARIQQEQASPFAMALRVLPQLIYGEGHAYSAPFTGSGSTETVSAMTRDDLIRFHQTWFQPRNATLIVVGATTLDELVPLLEKTFSSWRDASAPPEKNLAAVEIPATSTVYLIDKPEAYQSVIICGQVASPTNNPDMVTQGIMNYILGGAFSSRINMNLREDKHWTYGARSVLVDARGQRLFLVYSPVQTDKTDEAMAEIDMELRGILGNRPATQEELEKAQDNQTLRLPGAFETKSAVIDNIRRSVEYGLPEDYQETYPDVVRALTVPDVTASARAVVHPDQLVWVVVGDRNEIEADVRALGFGEIRLIDTEGNPVE